MRDSLTGAGPSQSQDIISGTPKSGNHQGDASIDRIRNMIPTCAIHWQGLVHAISRYRFKKQITRGRSREHGGSSCPATAVPVLKLYYQRMEIQPAAGNSRSSTKLVLPETENPAGRWPRRFQYQTCTTRERKSSRPLATAVPVLNLYYQTTKIQPATAVLNLYNQRTKI